MTLRQFEEKIKELVKTEAAAIMADCSRKFKSGAVDPTRYRNDYILPRLILASVMKDRGSTNLVRNNPEYYRTLKNLDAY